jgi:hypothetical protein
MDEQRTKYIQAKFLVGMSERELRTLAALMLPEAHAHGEAPVGRAHMP